MIYSMAADYVTHDEFDSAMTAIKQDFDRLDGKIDTLDAKVDRLEDKVDRGFENVDQRFVQVEQRLNQMEKTSRAILDVVNSIDAKTSTLPARVERLERSVFKL